PDDGLLHLSPTADTVTVAAATVREAAVLDAVLAGSGNAAPGREVLDVPPEPPAEGIRLGVPRDPCWDRVDADVARVCGRALDLLGEAGVESVEVDLADTVARATEVNLGMTAFEVRDYWTRFAGTHLGCDFATFVSRLASPDVAEALDALLDGPALSVDRYAALRAERDEVTRRYADLFATHRLDALVFPTVPVTAPAVGATTVRVDGRERDLLLTTIANGTAAPSAGLPAVTVPAGMAAD
ncbi:amidase family protein, partial [Saccharomonospora iraqiensis]|uniref:amidase family protein n=1 Tax=Saccharomonospora iraqiensis TaxID=52698 RepID=UPI00022DFD0F